MSSILTNPGSFVVGCNYWASHAGTRMWSDWQPDVVEEDLRQLAEGGLQVLRVFPLWPDFQPLTVLRGGAGRPYEYRLGEDPLPDTEAGQAGLSEEMLSRFQSFADLAQKYDLKLIVGLLTGWMSGRLFVPPALEGLNVITDPVAIKWESRFVRAFIRRFKAHPAVIAWDLGNEVNSMANVPCPEAAWAWTSAITSAIRAEDPSRPVVSGLHGMIDTWSPETMGELTDLLTTHPYPFWTQYCDQDPINTIRTILHSTAETRLYADLGGKPALAEEIGTLGPMLASDALAADFIRSCLFSLWANDCHGLLWWCAYDQDHLAHAPYDWNTCERELGLIHADRTPRPVLAAIGDFRKFLEGLPFEALPPCSSDAVCLLPKDTDHWALAYSAFVLARQAGINLEFQRGEQPLKQANIYIVPSVRGINVISRHRWLDLMERIRSGATLYLSLDDALLSSFKDTFGLEVQTRSKRSKPADLLINGMGELTIDSPYRLDLVTCGAEVLGCEPDGNPAFTRFAYGAGEVYFLSVPLERYLTETPGVFHDPHAHPFWKIYRQIAEKHITNRTVHKHNPFIGLSEHSLNETERVVVAVNYSPHNIEENLALTEGWQVGAVFYGEVDSQNTLLRLSPNQAAVFTVIRS